MNLLEVLNSSTSLIPSNEDIINQLFPNLWVFLSHILASLFLFLVVLKMAWKPTKKYIAKRTEQIQKDLFESEQSKFEAEKHLEESKQKLLDSREAASKIIENAEMEAEEKRKKIESAAVIKANNIEKEGMAQVKKQEIELEKRMNLEVSKLALETVELFLSKKMDDKENKVLIDKIVDDLTKRVDSKSKSVTQ